MNQSEDTFEKANSEFYLLGAGLLLLLLCYLPFLMGELDFVVLDCQLTYQPLCAFIGSCLRHGIFPLWNPHNYCGFPEIAVTSPGLYFPFNYLLFLLPYSRAEAIYLVLQQFLSGTAAFFVLQKLTNSKTASAFGALAVMLGGYMFAMYKFPDFVASVAALLFCFWTTSLFFRAGSGKKRNALAALCFSALMLFLSGRPEIFLPGLLLLAAHATAEIRSQRKSGTIDRETLFSLLFWGLTFVCALMLSAPVILPALEWSKLSTRAEGLNAAQVFQWSACWYDWFATVFLQPFGNLDALRAPVGTIHSIMQSRIPFMTAPFMGAGFFTAVCLGALDSAYKPRFTLLALVLLSAVVCAGDQTPVMPFLLNLVPQLGVLRYPIKSIIIPLLPAILLACRGLLWTMDRTQPSGKLLGFLAFWTAILILGPLLNDSGMFGSALDFICIKCNSGILPGEREIAQASLKLSFIVTGLSGACFALLAYIYRKMSMLRKSIATLGLIAIAIAPMFLNGISLRDNAAKGGFYQRTAALDSRLQAWTAESAGAASASSADKGRIAYLVIEPLSIPQSYVQTAAGDYARAYSQFSRDILMPDLHMSTRWKYSNGYALAETFQISDFTSQAFDQSRLHYPLEHDVPGNDYTLARFCSLSNSEYAVTIARDYKGEVRKLDPQLFTLAHSDDFLNLRFYKVNNCGSRFYFAGKLELIDSWRKLAADLYSASNRSILDDHITFISKSDLKFLNRQSMATGAAGPRLETFIRVISEQPNRVELEIQKNSPGLLVMRDQFYPGWQVSVDGQILPLLRANIINRGVFVTGGRHQVVFEYKPESLTYGYYLLALGLLSFVALWLSIDSMRLGTSPSGRPDENNNCNS